MVILSTGSEMQESELGLATLHGRVNNLFKKVNFKNVFLFVYALLLSCDLDENVCDSELKT